MSNLQPTQYSASLFTQQGKAIQSTTPAHSSSKRLPVKPRSMESYRLDPLQPYPTRPSWFLAGSSLQTPGIPQINENVEPASYDTTAMSNPRTSIGLDAFPLPTSAESHKIRSVGEASPQLSDSWSIDKLCPDLPVDTDPDYMAYKNSIGWEPPVEGIPVFHPSRYSKQVAYTMDSLYQPSFQGFVSHDENERGFSENPEVALQEDERHNQSYQQGHHQSVGEGEEWNVPNRSQWNMGPPGFETEAKSWKAVNQN
ncbi:hypothetical protein M231_03288 [Tremella mesenterica]|uniref:Uncharacterized protein n=1 Tax=Tremella mesenterica TaxID=5217 RepID=A0A4Q1BNK3_TREME|nr:hypothetical protein M231_03288 [Tremella mesenterica]